MNQIRLYLIARTTDGEWNVTTHRTLQSAKTQWKLVVAQDTNAVAVVHVGFSRPATSDLTTAIDGLAGRVLLTAAARWAIGGTDASSSFSVGFVESDVETDRLPLYLALAGWGYRVSDEELAPLTPESRPMFQDWLVNLENDEPELGADLLEAGAHSETTYVKCRAGLPRKLRDQVDRYRFQTLAPQIDPKDPIQILGIAPQWLLVRATSEAQVNVRIAGAFERHGIERLGDLLRFDRAAMLEWHNFGRTSLAKLADWLFVEAGSLPPDAQTEEHVATEGASLRECLENSLSALPSNPASILRGRLGANGTVRKLAEIGAELDLSRERVRQIEQRYTRKIIASYYWDDLLTEKISDRIASAGSPVYVDLLGAEDTWFRGFEGLEIYLSRVIEAFTEGDFFAFDLDGRLIVSRVRKSAWKGAERDASAYLGERHSPALSRRQVELALESIAVQASAGELSGHLFRNLESRMHFAFDSERGEEVLVGFGRSVEHTIRAVLTEAKEPLHYSEIAERVRARLDDAVDERRVHNALRDVGAQLFARGTYGFRQHVGTPNELCSAIAQDVEAIVLEGEDQRQWHCDELCALVLSERPEVVGDLDAYRLNVILQRAGGLESKGRLVWGKRNASSRAPKAPRINIRDACVDILRANGGPMTSDELDSALAKTRGVGRNHQIHSGGGLARLARKVWGLVDRDFKMTASRRQALLDDLVKLLGERGRGLHESELRPAMTARRIDIDDHITPSAVLGLADTDERFRVSRGRVVRLSCWDVDDTVTVRHAVERVMRDSPSLGSVALRRRVEDLLHRSVTIEELGDGLEDFGATLDRDGYTWLAPEEDTARADREVGSAESREPTAAQHALAGEE